MKKIYLIAVMFIGLSLGLTSCNDFLDRPPLDSLENSPEFYNNEQNIRYSLNELYPVHFSGYNSGWGRSIFGNQSVAATWSDDFAQKSVTNFTKQAPATSSAWSFTNLKKVNTLIAGIEASEMESEPKNHWLGACRFFRALENSSLVRDFGDIPYFDRPVDNTEIKELYKPREDRGEVMKKVLEDLTFASKNVRQQDGKAGVTVNRDVINAYAAKIMLFEASWQKYHKKNNALAQTFFTAAKNFAKAVMDTGKYSITDDYHALTTSITLAGNTEMILYRQYEAGINTHSVMSFDIEQPQDNSMSKSLIESYRTVNGLPIHQDGNAQYEGDKSFDKETANRDPRLALTIYTDRLRLENVSMPYAVTGYMSHKFINEALIGKADGQSSTNVMDAPVMRYAEVLLIYAESCAEIASLGGAAMTQADMDASINLIRDRKDVQMPHLTVMGDGVSVNGVAINDPAKDPDISSLIWEIRNERRVEMAMEGLRYDDLRRWKQLDKADMLNNPIINKGAFIDKEAIVEEFNASVDDPKKEISLETISNLTLDREGNKGYLKPVKDPEKLRRFETKHYLMPIPTNQIALYKDKSEQLGDPSIVLTQNPGW